MDEKKWLYDFRFLSPLLFIISFIFVSITLEAKVINGVDIPEEFIAKIKEYRWNYHHDNCIGSRDRADYFINELDYFIKQKVKYDATYYCKICDVFFPISSKCLEVRVPRSEYLCLDGFPENIDFRLPPECPYCGCIYPKRELNYEDEDVYEDLSLRSRFDEINSEIANPCERYIAMQEFLYNISDYEKYKIYFKYACSPNCTDVKENLKKSLEYFNKFLEKTEENVDFIFERDNVNYGYAFFKVELLRQMGEFEKASEYINKLEQITDGSSYFIDYIKELISKKNTKRALRPFGNKIHLAIMNSKSISKINIPKEEKVKLAKERNANKHNAFIQAIYAGDLNAVKYLGEADKTFITDIDYYDNIALHIAAKVGNVEMIELLLKLGSDIEAQNVTKQTPICLAIRCGNLSAFNYFLKRGANLNIIDSEGRTPLQIACIGKNKNGLKILSKLIEIEKGKDNYKESIQRCYEVTARWGCPETYYLLKRTGIIDLSSISKVNGNSVLELVKDNGAESILYKEYLDTLNDKNEEKLEAFKKADLYDVFMKRYEKECRKQKTER